jgi:hypothetical protein
MTKGKFSHITLTSNVSDTHEKTLCGSYVTGINLRAIYFDGNKYALPLCPKCAAARLIAETTSPAQ